MCCTAPKKKNPNFKSRIQQKKKRPEAERYYRERRKLTEDMSKTTVETRQILSNFLHNLFQKKKNETKLKKLNPANGSNSQRWNQSKRDHRSDEMTSTALRWKSDGFLSPLWTTRGTRHGTSIGCWIRWSEDRSDT